MESLNLALLSLLRATPWKLSLARPMAWLLGTRDASDAGDGCNDGRIHGAGGMLRGILGSRAAKNTLLVVTVWLPADGLGNRAAVLESLRPAAERALGLLQAGHTTCTVAADCLGKLPVAAGSALPSPPKPSPGAKRVEAARARARLGLPLDEPPVLAAAAPQRAFPGLLVSSRPFPRADRRERACDAQHDSARTMYEAASKHPVLPSPAANAAVDLKSAARAERAGAASDTKLSRCAGTADSLPAGAASPHDADTGGLPAGARAGGLSRRRPIPTVGAASAAGNSGMLAASLSAESQGGDQAEALATALAGLSEALMQEGLGPTAAAVAALAPPSSAAGRARQLGLPLGTTQSPVPPLELSAVLSGACGRGFKGAHAGRSGAKSGRSQRRKQSSQVPSRLDVAEGSVTAALRRGAATARPTGGLGRLSNRSAAGALVRAAASTDMHAGRLVQGTARGRQANARASNRLRATGAASLAVPPRAGTLYPQQRLTPGGALRGTLVDASCVEWPASLP